MRIDVNNVKALRVARKNLDTQTQGDEAVAREVRGGKEGGKRGGKERRNTQEKS